MPDKKPRGINRGLTLIELIIYIAISTLVLTILFELFIQQTRLGNRRASQTDIERSAVTGIEIVKSAIQSANTVVSSHSFDGVAFSSSSSTLILELPSVDSSGDIVSGSSDFMVFFQDQNNQSLLKMTTVAGVGSARPSHTRVIANFVDTVQFSYNKGNIVLADTINVSLNTKTVIGTETLYKTTEAKIKIRNK